MNQPKTKENQTDQKLDAIIKVAVVDDDEDFLAALKLVLDETDGLQCAGLYSTAESALKEIPIALPDLVLMDIRMTGLDGIECAEHLKTVSPGLKIAMFSAFVEKQLVWRAMAVGIRGYLVKGMPIRELLNVIFSLAQGGVYLSPIVQEQITETFHSFNAKIKGGLSPREREILLLIFQSRSDKEISTELKISESTVRTHVQDLFRKLGVHSRQEAIAAFLGLPKWPPT